MSLRRCVHFAPRRRARFADSKPDTSTMSRRPRVRQGLRQLLPTAYFRNACGSSLGLRTAIAGATAISKVKL
jgi:hypothetical protein